MTVTSSHLLMPIIARFSAIAVVSCWALSANAQNLVTNGTFDSGTVSPWWDYAADGAAQTVEVTDGAMCSTITAGGENTWDVILGLSGLGLVAGQYYHVAFAAFADADRTIRFKTGLGDTPYTDYFLKNIKLTPVAQSFDYTYLNLREDPEAQFQFHIGGSAGRVCVDNIVVEPVAAPPVPAYTTQSLTGHPLKDYAAFVKIGTAVDTPTFLSEPLHNAILTGEFNMMTPANSMKMNIIQGVQGVFDFVDTDALLAFAEQNGMEFHGHPLIWHTQAPAWLEETEFSRDEMIQIMYAHIDALVGRYAGRIPYWDVVNEAIETDGTVYDFRHTIWYDRIGPDFIDLAFQRARQDDPNALLLYNDYNSAVMGHPKADRVFQLVSDMKSRGIPIDQVGLQNHWFITPDGGTSGLPDVNMIRANLDRYAQIGVGVQFTEFDVRIGLPITEEKLQMQAQIMGDILQACLDAPNCAHVTVWGMSDFDSWVPSTFPDYDSAHIFDANFVAKPAYHSMSNVLAAFAAANGAGDNPPASGAGGGGKSSSGCSVVARPRSGKDGWQLGLLGLLGLSFGLRRVPSRRRPPRRSR